MLFSIASDHEVAFPKYTVVDSSLPAPSRVITIHGKPEMPPFSKEEGAGSEMRRYSRTARMREQHRLQCTPSVDDNPTDPDVKVRTWQEDFQVREKNQSILTDIVGLLEEFS